VRRGPARYYGEACEEAQAQLCHKLVAIRRAGLANYLLIV
jgi:hypothetical protein